MRFCLGLLLFLAMVCVVRAGGVCSIPTISTGHASHPAVILAVPVAADYYYTVGGSEQRIADEVVRRLETRLRGQGQPIPAAAAPTPGRLDRSAFRLAGAGEAALRPDAGGEQPVLAVMERSCVQCHKPGASKPGNIQLFTAERTLFVDPDPARELRRRQRVYDSVSSGDMPKGGRPLSPSDRAILDSWVQQARSLK